jgi:hypothetical protein
LQETRDCRSHHEYLQASINITQFVFTKTLKSTGSKRSYIKQKEKDQRPYTLIIDAGPDEETLTFFDPVCIFPQLY